jgi:hypothetical protein
MMPPTIWRPSSTDTTSTGSVQMSLRAHDHGGARQVAAAEVVERDPLS